MVINQLEKDGTIRESFTIRKTTNAEKKNEKKELDPYKLYDKVNKAFSGNVGLTSNVLKLFQQGSVVLPTYIQTQRFSNDAVVHYPWHIDRLRSVIVDTHPNKDTVITHHHTWSIKELGSNIYGFKKFMRSLTIFRIKTALLAKGETDQNTKCELVFSPWIEIPGADSITNKKEEEDFFAKLEEILPAPGFSQIRRMWSYKDHILGKLRIY